MERGWSVRVLSAPSGDPRQTVKWYIVAEAEPAAAVERLRIALGLSDAQIEAVQTIPPLFQGRRLARGEFAFLYSRGTPRTS